LPDIITTVTSGVRGPHLGQDLEAALPRHHHVEQHQVDVALAELLQADGARARHLDRVALDLERHLHGLQDVGLVIDDQDRGARHGAGRLPPRPGRHRAAVRARLI
jgi:hypothetical protein